MAGNGGPVTPRTAVIRVLVGALADSSLLVRDAAAAALRENAQQNAAIILDCCTASLRVGKRVSEKKSLCCGMLAKNYVQRGGQFGSHHAGVFSIMAYTVQNMGEEQLDPIFMRKMAKVALGEMTSTKDYTSDWQRAAASLLVALGSRLPDMMMDEVFLQLAGNMIPVYAVVPIFADFATVDALQFAPRVKGVLSRVLPVLGGVRDNQRRAFAKAFTCWCQAIVQYHEDCPNVNLVDNDMQALFQSVFDLFLNSWVSSREPKVRLAAAEALGEMVVFIGRLQLKAALPRILPAILGVLKKEREDLLPVTRSLHMILDTVLITRERVPMIDFQALTPVLNAIIPMASVSSNKLKDCDPSFYLKNHNEVMRCFVTIGVVCPEDMFHDLIHRIGSREEGTRLGALSVLKHLLTRLSETWMTRRTALAESVKSLLQESDLNTRKAVAELIVAIAANGYMEADSSELFMEFLVRQCAIPDREVEAYRTEQTAIEKAMGLPSVLPSKNELKVGAVSPAELRAVCEKSLLLLAGTMAETECFLWPYLLKVLIPINYTGAVATVCKCISEISRRRLASGEIMTVDYAASSGVPHPDEILARLLVLLQNPMAREQLAARILTVLFYLAPLFPKSVVLLWEDEIPKLKAFISDPEDMRGESWQQATWDDMIVHLLSESIDVIQNSQWTLSLGNAFASHYDLYTGDHPHSALLHRCLGMLLQKLDDRDYVQRKISLMYKRADVANEANRLGLAMGMGLVAASHLDTVLEKLKKVLESQGRNRFRRLLSVFFDQSNRPDVDDVFAALALMYGYAASYAPSSAIEARIETLVGTNMLSGLLGVRTATAKQAVITAIDLLGQAVIRAGANGAPFPLKKRDQMLDFTMALMAGQSQAAGYILGASSVLETEQLLHTQELAVNACTTLVSVEPKLPMVARDRILQATLGFFALPSEPSAIVNSLLSNLTTLLCAILLTSAEDGKSRADQLQHLLRNLDQYVSSPVEHQRERACVSVLAVLRQFRALCTTGICPVNCGNNCMHLPSFGDRSMSNTSAPLLLPPREELKLGERTMAYIPRCADVTSDIRKTSAQILDLLFSIALLLPKLVGSATENKQPSYAALSALEELIAVTNWVCTSHSASSSDTIDVMRRIVASVGILLTSEELVACLRGCQTAICDRIPQASQGTIMAVTQLIARRGNELQDSDIPKVTQSLLASAAAVGDKKMRQQVLNSICCLAEHAQAKVVFDELLTSAEKDSTRKDTARNKGPLPLQEAYLAVADHEILALPFLEHVIRVINQTPVYKANDVDKDNEQLSAPSSLNPLPQSATLALGAIFRGTFGKLAVLKSYSGVLCSLVLRIGSCHGTIGLETQPLRDVVSTFHSFCECVDDEEMGKVLARDGEHRLSGDRWIEAVEEIATCSARSRPEEVNSICTLLWPALKRPYDFQRAAAAAALSEYIRHSDGDALLNNLVGALSAHIGDDSHSVRRLCVKGLVQIPKKELVKYASQVLSVIVALIEDDEEEVAFAAAQGLSSVLEVVPEENVSPIMLNLCVRLRSLQSRQNLSMRAAAFAALGVLSRFNFGGQQDAFLEQVHSCLPRLIFHVNDEASAVRHACKATLRKIAPLLQAQEITSLMNSRAFDSDRRLDYDEFVRDFSKHLVSEFGDRADSYIISAIQAFDSPWPLIQANAAYFAGCLLSRLSDRRPLALYLPQITASLMKMTANAPSAIVRTKSAAALSLLITEIPDTPI
ncbi:maestro heat-like repeat-containing protein family member 1 [Marchantia polymorpha subsp. ruderalis]|uniref:Condensin complex subunit 1 C-terminal domain-containing protein n=1 Tax=Marchantia polymorpha TaxID=3197 RepID=A0A2R6XMB4_MARPO|nr:hypothetical protein MARPO_0008s0039 [Marchantia polymorpha]BBN19571.1 hypothetical protein Mp_8g11770 [Marchantia polymorpha subsp. ruderalis]|eukprot:PTQ47253.1 hypothetical protein MARPO_0008s0039 [Marchantia polymorpha]